MIKSIPFRVVVPFAGIEKASTSAGSFVSFSIKGDKKLAKGLKQFPGNIQKRIMRNAMRKAMTPISLGAKKALQQDINTARNPEFQPMWGRGKNVVNPRFNRESRIAKLKVLRKSIHTVVRSGPKYTKRGNMVASTGKRYGDRFPADPAIPKSLHNQYINPFARRWERGKHSYLRTTMLKERHAVMAIFRREVSQGIQREARRTFANALKTL